MYKLRTTVRRVGSLLAALGVIAGSVFSAMPAFADALNPLTDRSLTLSSSAPGWDYKDGSGNTTYATPGSGANGKQTGNTFSFKVSTDSSGSGPAVKGFSFQYCTSPAGDCTAPGDDANADVPGTDDASHADLNVVAGSDTHAPSELSTFGTLFDATSGQPNSVPAADDSDGNYIVMTKDVGADTWTQSTGWSFATTNNETGSGALTGKNNYITLVDDGDGATGLKLHAGAEVKVVFFATDNNYITNPGSGAFFVKINDYKSATLTDGDFDPADIVDGGVTVANVMNQSISIQTKVLETMDFSVGTVDPDTLSDAQLTTATTDPDNPNLNVLHKHTQCNPILMTMDPQDDTQPANTLILGDPSSDNSLSTTHTYSTHSYWRLSSNSSAGATVYYSGVTLSNTEGDKIKPIGTTADTPKPGSEQFGLALDNGTAADGYAVDYNEELNTAKGVYENGADNAAAGIAALNPADATPSTGTGLASDVSTDWTGLADTKTPQLRVHVGAGGDDADVSLAPTAAYADGTGAINSGYGDNSNTKFAFDENSNAVPAALATESSAVVDCATGKVRYIGNIAATTPAGIYTTKVNYIAAPQY